MHYLWITACLSLCCPAIASTWIVDDDGPADFDNIQNAISIASAGDTVLVEPGIYTRSLANNFVMDLLGKPITVRATGSPDATIIDGEGLCTNVVVCSSGEDSGTRIEGFTITGGSNAGIFANGGSPTVVDCTLTGNASGARILAPGPSSTEFIDCMAVGNTLAGFYLGSPALLLGCTIEGNTGSYAVFANNGCVISDCVITMNTCTYGGVLSKSATITRCIISNNTALSGTGGGIRINQSSDIPTLTQTSVCENTPYQIDGAYTDAGSNTIAETCPPTGACCTNGECVIALEEDCLTFHGSWNGIGSTCYERDCTPGCTGDVNVDGLVNVLDLLEVIAVWGTCP